MLVLMPPTFNDLGRYPSRGVVGWAIFLGGAEFGACRPLQTKALPLAHWRSVSSVRVRGQSPSHSACRSINVGGQVLVNAKSVGQRREECVLLRCVRFNGNTRRRVDLYALRR
jgi:hypothetical protein